jgi:hypothetical protein
VSGRCNSGVLVDISAKAAPTLAEQTPKPVKAESRQKKWGDDPDRLNQKCQRFKLNTMILGHPVKVNISQLCSRLAVDAYQKFALQTLTCAATTGARQHYT